MPRIRTDEEIATLGALRIGIIASGRFEFDFEPAATHAEFAEHVGNRRADALCRAAARRRQQRGRPAVVCREPLALTLQDDQVRSRRTQCLEFRAQDVSLRLQLRHRHAVLARKFVQLAELCVEFVETLRIEIKRALVARERAGCFVDLDARGLEQVDERAELRIERAEPRTFGLRTRENACHGELALAVEQIGQSGGSLHKLPRVGQAAMLVFERVEFPGAERVQFEFADLMLQPVDALGLVLAVRQRIDARIDFAPGARESRDTREFAGMAPERSEQGELLATVEQCLVFVLPVDFDQPLAERLQLRQRYRTAVDPRARTAFAADDAAQLARSDVIELFLAQPGSEVVTSGEVELGRQLGAFATMPDHCRVRAIAGEQQQRIDEQRLAGTGFPGDHGQSGSERDFGLADHGEILDVERAEHAHVHEGECEVSRRPALAASPRMRMPVPGQPRAASRRCPGAGDRRHAAAPDARPSLEWLAARYGRVYPACMASSPVHSLDSRSRSLLRSLIARYIAEGQPVGSRTLAKSSGLDVSPATIRNILADLEEAGLIAAPHTSAGRVPTAQGYRVFVDSLLEMRPLGEPQVEQLRRELPTAAATPALLGSASTLLSEMTRFVGVVSVPKHDEFPFRHIDFVALDANRVLVILVFTDGQVQNRVIETQHAYTPGELEQTANFLNSHYAGLRLEEIRMRLLREMRDEGARLNRLLASAVEVAQAAFQSPADNDMLVSGQTNLMGVHEATDVDRLRDLFDAFQRKRDLLQLLERCSRAEGVRLFIGEESGFAALDGYSLVTAPYGVGGRVLGVLGVIGPTRMAYERVIPVVAATAQLISGALNRTGAPP